jgi:hypothetical protein
VLLLILMVLPTVSGCVEEGERVKEPHDRRVAWVGVAVDVPGERQRQSEPHLALHGG